VPGSFRFGWCVRAFFAGIGQQAASTIAAANA
jgi:hypothetical protein